MAFVNLGQIIYPIGSYYISNNETSPATLFGGSWAEVTGKFLYCNSSITTGGSNTHILTTNEMPSHNHQTGSGNWIAYIGKATSSETNTAYTYVPNGQYCFMAGSNFSDWTLTGKSTGGGAAHNNMPAYQSVYCWRRTA